MKYLITTLLLILCSSSVIAQDWLFSGVQVYTDTGTHNKNPTQYGYSWILMDGNKSKNKKLFKQAAKDVHKKINTVFKSTKNHNYVAVYQISVMKSARSGPKKMVKYYKFYSGKTTEAIEKKIQSDDKLHKYDSYKRVELIDMKKQREILNRQSENPVFGREVK